MGRDVLTPAQRAAVDAAVADVRRYEAMTPDELAICRNCGLDPAAFMENRDRLRQLGMVR